MYLQQVEGDKWKGEKMDFAKIQRLSGTCPPILLTCQPPNKQSSTEDQMVQLYELMESIKNPSSTTLDDGEAPAKKWMKS